MAVWSKYAPMWWDMYNQTRRWRWNQKTGVLPEGSPLRIDFCFLNDMLHAQRIGSVYTPRARGVIILPYLILFELMSSNQLRWRETFKSASIFHSMGFATKGPYLPTAPGVDHTSVQPGCAGLRFRFRCDWMSVDDDQRSLCAPSQMITWERASYTGRCAHTNAQLTWVISCALLDQKLAWNPSRGPIISFLYSFKSSFIRRRWYRRR